MKFSDIVYHFIIICELLTFIYSVIIFCLIIQTSGSECTNQTNFILNCSNEYFKNNMFKINYPIMLYKTGIASYAIVISFIHFALTWVRHAENFGFAYKTNALIWLLYDVCFMCFVLLPQNVMIHDYVFSLKMYEDNYYIKNENIFHPDIITVLIVIQALTSVLLILISIIGIMRYVFLKHCLIETNTTYMYVVLYGGFFPMALNFFVLIVMLNYQMISSRTFYVILNVNRSYWLSVVQLACYSFVSIIGLCCSRKITEHTNEYINI